MDLRRILIGQVAQSVEHRTENPGVGGSIPPLSTVRISPHEVATIGIVRASVCAPSDESFNVSEENMTVCGGVRGLASGSWLAAS